MGKYRVAHRFASELDAEVYSWQEGDTVDLADELAEWVNRSSAGTLEPQADEVEEAELTEDSTLAEMREYAKAKSLNLHGATSKADVWAAIQEAEHATPPPSSDEDPLEDPDDDEVE